jgi:hypothetical protein
MLGVMKHRALGFVFPILLACGAPDKPAASAGDVAEKGSAVEGDAPGSDGSDEREGGDAIPAADAGGMPTKCEEQGEMCMPPKNFVKKLCQGDYPSVAAAMFQAGTPWTRAYLVHPVEAWNASGGGSSREKLATDEEVLILRHRSVDLPAGMSVSGASGGFDALRWDGMCVTLEQGHVVFDPPRKPKNARVIWARLDLGIRDALKKDPEVLDAYIEHKKECKGVTMGQVSKACEKLDADFSVLIATHIREKGGLPAPAKLPD